MVSSGLVGSAHSNPKGARRCCCVRTCFHPCRSNSLSQCLLSFLPILLNRMKSFSKLCKRCMRSESRQMADSPSFTSRKLHAPLSMPAQPTANHVALRDTMNTIYKRASPFPAQVITTRQVLPCTVSSKPRTSSGRNKIMKNTLR